MAFFSTVCDLGAFLVGFPPARHTLATLTGLIYIPRVKKNMGGSKIIPNNGRVTLSNEKKTAEDIAKTTEGLTERHQTTIENSTENSL